MKFTIICIILLIITIAISVFNGERIWTICYSACLIYEAVILAIEVKRMKK